MSPIPLHDQLAAIERELSELDFDGAHERVRLAEAELEQVPDSRGAGAAHLEQVPDSRGAEWTADTTVAAWAAVARETTLEHTSTDSTTTTKGNS